jgi:replicative superfamily II helicase
MGFKNLPFFPKTSIFKKGTFTAYPQETNTKNNNELAKNMTEDEETPQETSIPTSSLERLLHGYKVNPQITARLREIGIKKFTTIQYFSVIWDLFQGKNLLVCAATSAGKTLIGEMACINAILTKKQRCLYLVPLKALAHEKLESFKAHWTALGVQVEMSTGDMTILDRKAEEEKLKKVHLLITTYERGDSIFRSSPQWFETVGVVVVDEIHNIGEEGRGPRLEGFITRLKTRFPEVQFIYLSATIGNPKELADWTGSTLIQHSHRPVPLEYQMVLAPNRNEKIKELAQDILRNKEATLIFTPTRFEAEQLCNELATFITEKEFLYLIDQRELRAAVGQFRDQIRSRFDQRLFYSIQKGVAFHHAGLSSEMRTFVENLFRQGLIKIIACTPTLSSGVNLPARFVIVKDVGLTRDYLQVNPNMFHQMCGRAGRPGYDDRGKAIILASCKGELADIQVIYFQPRTLIPKYANVESKLLTNLLEQYLIWVAESPNGIKDYNLEEKLRRSFWFESTRQRQPDLNIDYLVKLGSYSIESFLLRYSSPQTVREARSIPDANVQIRQRDPHKLEAIITDRFALKTYYSRDHPDCACGKFDYRNLHKAKLCRHLVKLAQVIYRENPSYAKDIILASLHEEQIVDKLLRFGMIKIQNDRLRVTPFGMQTFLLYLTPETAHWLRLELPRIASQDQLLTTVMYVYDRERKYRAKAELQEVLKRIVREENPDLSYVLQKIGDDFKIYPGDMQEFIESIRWILYCVSTLAALEGVTSVKDLADQVLNRIIPSHTPPIPPARSG